MLKRSFDLLVASLALLVLLPIIVATAILVRVNLSSPVIFQQQRPGLNGHIFKLLKFRTMLDVYDEHGEPLPDKQRMTRLGAILRKTSLDELPGLVNVLKGDMSLVGPRPLLVQYLPLYNKEQARRHDVRPGITGWAQVNGRNAISWEEKFVYDVWYVDHASFWLDIKILLLTVLKVIRSDDINAQGHATIEPFKGPDR